MRAAAQPTFLARRSYRRRRLIDAARILPVVGLFYFLVPILWHPAETSAPDTARGGLFIFAGWLMLVVAAFLLARILTRAEPPAVEDEDEADPGPGAEPR